MSTSKGAIEIWFGKLSLAMELGLRSAFWLRALHLAACSAPPAAACFSVHLARLSPSFAQNTAHFSRILLGKAANWERNLQRSPGMAVTSTASGDAASAARSPWSISLLALLLLGTISGGGVVALDNGFLLPAMGWSALPLLSPVLPSPTSHLAPLALSSLLLSSSVCLCEGLL